MNGSNKNIALNHSHQTVAPYKFIFVRVLILLIVDVHICPASIYLVMLRIIFSLVSTDFVCIPDD